MKRKIIALCLLPIVAMLIFVQCQKDNEQKYHYDLKFITENYKPLNYSLDGEITGLAPELLKEICDQLNIPFHPTVMPWNEGYNTALNTDNAVLFSTALNVERKNQFKWAGPIAALEWTFYAKAQNHIQLQSLDDARQIGAIGVIQDYAMEQYLLGQNFTNLVYCTDNEDAFQKLLQGEIDLYPSDKVTAEAALDLLGHTIYNVKEVLPIHTEMIYLAFNPMVPDDVVADFQQAIDELKKSGFVRELHQKYLNTSHFPGVLQIYTEDYPPLTFLNSYGEVNGFGADLVHEIMKRNGIYADIKLSTWSNGYELALHNPNFCLFTMDRTEIRENLFQWVGPIGTNATYFYTKAGSGISINSMEDARNLGSVGTVSSWFSDQYLRDLGFTNLVSEEDPGAMTQKLMLGEVDAFVCSEVTFPTILREQGFEYEQIVPAFTLMSSDYYVSFSKSTDESFVSQWQTTLDAMKADGTYAAIYSRWFPN
ncbi:MAG: transporter substrate-binding domain-containing protein [Bacteroidetes bacterium]|jgi:ABC-type amino acid transport substrate-binding protein|nr:transporter substrate-binding domain-containing protein [Bacteroidota bacterium]